MKLFHKNIVHPYLDLMAIVFVIVVIAGSILGFMRFREVEAAKEQLAANLKQEKTLVGDFDRLMILRGEFLAVNAKVNAELSALDAKVKDGLAQKEAWDEQAAATEAGYQADIAAIKAHNDAEDEKYRTDPRYRQRDYWTFPIKPGQPPSLSIEFSGEKARLTERRVELSAFIEALTAKRAAYSGNDELKRIYNDLLQAAKDMEFALKRNIELLDTLVVTAKEGQIVSGAKADLLRYDAEDKRLKACAKNIADFIRNHELKTKDYDVPGGTDVDPADKSQLK